MISLQVPCEVITGEDPFEFDGVTNGLEHNDTCTLRECDFVPGQDA